MEVVSDAIHEAITARRPKTRYPDLDGPCPAGAGRPDTGQAVVQRRWALNSGDGARLRGPN